MDEYYVQNNSKALQNALYVDQDLGFVSFRIMGYKKEETKYIICTSVMWYNNIDLKGSECNVGKVDFNIFDLDLVCM